MITFHLQTVFEGADRNTPASGRKHAEAHRIEAPVGFDARLDGARLSWLMLRNGAGGTPWTLVIDGKGVVRHSAVTPEDPAPLISLIERLRREKAPVNDGRSGGAGRGSGG